MSLDSSLSRLSPEEVLILRDFLFRLKLTDEALDEQLQALIADIAAAKKETQKSVDDNSIDDKDLSEALMVTHFGRTVAFK